MADGSFASTLDYRHPDYLPVFRRRADALARVRVEPTSLPLLRAYYREHPIQFIVDWGMTYDPRNAEVGLPTLVPFILFPKQVEFAEYILRKWLGREPGLVEKSRECGATWIAIALSCTLCLFNEGLSIGFGSRKAEYVDKIGEPKSILEKGRIFMENLPVEFRGGWTRENNGSSMKLTFPGTGSIIGGEGGDDIGRGDRRSIYFVDESAHLEHPELADMSLSMTTNCRIDISSVNGRANPFAEKRFGGNIEVFTFLWRDDPRKSEEWREKKLRELGPVVVAQEIDIDYNASVEGALIPSAWVQAAVDAHKKMGIIPSGSKIGALDVGDSSDNNAFCGATGVVVDFLEEWSGAGSDIFATTTRAFSLCDDRGYREFRYDADGIGASVRGDARVLNERRGARPKITATIFRGSAAVERPTSQDVEGRANEDYFANLKAQQYWSLRLRFYRTFLFVTQGKGNAYDEMISLSSSLPLLNKLMVELSQPTYATNGAGKIVVDKMPDGARSPNLSDAVMIRMARLRAPLVVPRSLLASTAS